MAEDLIKSPVPVRLAYRYPNGSMVSYSARAIARKGDSVTVVVNEFFDDGITLAVHAPFLEGLTNFRVITVSRSIRKPGYFETLLRPSEAVPVGPGNGIGAGSGTKPEEPSGQDWEESGERAAKQAARLLLPKTIAAAAGMLAERLEDRDALRFSQALREVPAELRPAALVVAVAAVLHCLEGTVQVRSLLMSARDAGRFPASQHRPAEVVRKAG